MNDFLSCVRFCYQNGPFPAETAVTAKETVTVFGKISTLEVAGILDLTHFYASAT